jgi:tetrahydromethanopterin S-methyltransferase subunit G
MKPYLTCLLASLLLLTTISLPVSAQTGDAATVEKIKIKVAKLGVGEKAKATVLLKDGTKTKGYIAQAGEDDFVLRDRKTDAASTIRYNDVAKVESNRGHSTARNIGIGVGIGVGSLLAIIFITLAHLD